MKALINTTLAAAVVGALAVTTMQAQAGDVTEVTASNLSQTQEVTVSFADIDLSTAKGQEVLYYRIVRAAEDVCGTTELRKAGSLAQVSRNKACFKESLSRALDAVPSAMVAAN